MVWNVSYKTRMDIRSKIVMWTSYTETMCSKTMVEPSFWMRVASYKTLWSPNVNVNSIQGSYNWVGLIASSLGHRPEATGHSFRSHEHSAQCPALTLTPQIQPLDWTKCKLVVVQNIFCVCETTMWMSYWYDITWNVVWYDIASYDNVNELTVHTKRSVYTHSYLTVTPSCKAFS